jgi:hypothetical protein
LCFIAKEAKMGSIEVYDSKLAKWVPYIPDFKKWEQHFIDISEGRVRPDHKGRYIVGSGSIQRTTSKTAEHPKVTLVTPVAQAVEMAKSELERETGNVIRGEKRPALQQQLGPVGKRLKTIQRHNKYKY